MVATPREILVVEDNPLTRKMVRLVLETKGMRVIEAEDVAGALAAAGTHLPDLVLQDLVLPDGTGFELAERLRRLPGGAELPIVAMSGLVSRAEEARFEGGLFNAVLVKPIEPSQIVATVRGFLPAPRASRPIVVGAPRVLIVDDDPVQLKLLRIELSLRGFRVAAARDGQEALELARLERPGLIVSDVMMPRLDGFGLCQAVRRDPDLARTPVVLMSAHYLDDADRKLAHDAGASELATRDGSLDEVVAALLRCLDLPAPAPRRDAPQIADEHQRRLMGQLEKQASMRAGLAQRVALQGAVLSVVRRMSEVLGRRGDLRGALEDVLYSIVDVASGTVAALYLLDRGALVLAAHAGVGSEEAPGFFAAPELFREVHVSGEAQVLTRDAATHERVLVRAASRSGIAVSVEGGGERIGVLFLGFPSTWADDEDRTGLARAVAAQIGQAVALGRSIAALSRSQERYRTLLEHATDGVILAADDGTVLEINRRGEQLLGAARGELIGRPFSVVVPPEERAAWDERLAAVLEAGEARRNDVPLLGLDGVRRLVDYSTSVVRFGDERVLLTIARDAGERARVEAQLRQAQKMEAVARLTGGIAHDFNNILAAILAHSHFLLDDLSPDDPRRADADEVRAAAERGAALTRQLLAFSRSQVLEPTVLDLNGIVGGLEKMLRRLIGEDIELRFVRAAGLGAVRADAGQIEQVIMNLVVNSRDAMPLGGKLTIETANVDLDAPASDDYGTVDPARWVTVEVRDTGSGMDADTLRRVFDPFFTTKEKGKGTGLGLSVSYGIVKQSGGTIGISSRPGHGATFRVYLPRIEEEPRVATTRPVKAPVRGTETVLVVEDDDRVRAVVKRMLIDQGYRVLLARGADEALAVCGTHVGPIALVLSDVVMPGKTGVELVAEVRKLRREIRILLMTGYSDHAVMRTADPETAFIQKPFGPDALARKVREVLS